MVLRAVEVSDGKLLFDLYARDPVATKYMSFKCTGRLEDTQDYVSKSAQFFSGTGSPIRNFQWVLIEKMTGEPIGAAGFGPKDSKTLSGGYILAQKWWGKGFATEAFTPLVNWGKSQPGVLRIEATHHRDNPASGKVLKKSGLSFEGMFPALCTYPNVSDQPQDSALYSWNRS